ncbi:hypothetical protein BEK98_03950 [Streptomyces diastatochromogenes]|uniref:Uncharacterized protein n=1 Tax=Streptomyces diastatochromogenes TaxID=42236 RepID=A0A233SU20_STRDA|nr:hypothetical protein [Streptomyces diastatochromogenes]OXY99136.1 hypothetical protein BEK98_03950 [Streptomyces diastatochromogenes]
MLADSARRTEQQFFRGMLHQQLFQSGRQVVGLLLLVLGDGSGHGVTDEVPGALSADGRSLSDGRTGGLAESEVQQDAALLVRVVAGEDIDGQHLVEPVPKYAQRASGTLRALQSQQSGLVDVAGQWQYTACAAQLTVGGGPGQDDFYRVVRGHDCVAFLFRLAGP